MAGQLSKCCSSTPALSASKFHHESSCFSNKFIIIPKKSHSSRWVSKICSRNHQRKHFELKYSNGYPLNAVAFQNDTYGLFNVLIPSTTFFSAIESSSWLTTLVRRPKFILCTGGNTTGYIPTHTGQSPTSSGLLAGNFWRNLPSWMPHRETSSPVQQTTQDGRFPGRGRTLSSVSSQTASGGSPDSSLQDRLLENNNTTNHPTQPGANVGTQLMSDGRQPTADSAIATAYRVQHPQGYVASDEEIQKLVAMGFERTQVEVALAAADGDLNVAVEILMSQQG